MEIFHYLAHELKSTPLFSCSVEQPERVGAIYNDFDNENPFDTVTSQFSLSQLFEIGDNVSNSQAVSEGDVDYALLEADKNENIFQEHMMFETDSYDVTSERPNKAYRTKVHDIITKEAKSLNITDEIVKIFDRRERSDWSLPDTVYDAWLIVSSRPRSWFPYSKFISEHPHCMEYIKSNIEKENLENVLKEESSTEDDIRILTKLGKKRRIISSEESDKDCDAEQQKRRRISRQIESSEEEESDIDLFVPLSQSDVEEKPTLPLQRFSPRKIWTCPIVISDSSEEA